MAVSNPSGVLVLHRERPRVLNLVGAMVKISLPLHRGCGLGCPKTTGCRGCLKGSSPLPVWLQREVCNRFKCIRRRQVHRHRIPIPPATAVVYKGKKRRVWKKNKTR